MRRQGKVRINCRMEGPGALSLFGAQKVLEYPICNLGDHRACEER